MNWDKLTEHQCLVEPACDMSGGVNEPPTSGNGNGNGSGADPRCQDPTFAAMHPELCPGDGTVQARLILKPELLTLCQLQDAKLTAYLIADESEVEITGGVEFSSSDLDIVLVGLASGNVTGVGEGIGNIGATYQGLTAYAQVEVLPECCDEQSVGMLLLVDVSMSMAAQFGAPYATRLNFSKILGRRFINELNTTKDKIGIMSFAEVAVLDQDFSQDIPALRTTLQDLVQSSAKTNLEEALSTAIERLDLLDVDRKVIVLFTDGDNKLGIDPGPAATDFRSRGGILLVVGVRAHDGGWNLLERIASGGFFLNGLPSNATETSDFLSGLKGYFCAGNCAPTGDVVASVPRQNFDNFTNWDVIAGEVDLIGEGNTGIKLYDILPGNGLYVDLAGSGPLYLGTIASKTTFNFTPGNTYRLSYKLAGNNRQDAVTFTHIVRITVENAKTVDRQLNDPFQPFTTYTDEFTVLAPVSGRVLFQQLFNVPGAYVAFGNPLDSVRLEIVGGAVLLEDNFDGENSMYVPEPCQPVIPPIVVPTDPCGSFSSASNPFCIAGYHDDFFKYGDTVDCGCSEGDSNLPAWNGCFRTGPPDRIEPCLWWIGGDLDDISHSVLAHNGQRIEIGGGITWTESTDVWDLFIFCSSGQTVWHGHKSGGTNPAGTYTRDDGCSTIASLGITHVETQSGGSVAYGGYACYGYGCLTEPLPAQIPDPNPLVDLEA